MADSAKLRAALAASLLDVQPRPPSPHSPLVLVGRGGKKSAGGGEGGKKEAKRAKANPVKSAEDEGAKGDMDEEDKMVRIQLLMGALIDAPSNGNDKDVGGDDGGVDDRKPAAVKAGKGVLHDHIVAKLQGHTKTGGNLEWSQYYKKTAAELANMPTNEQLVQLPGPDRKMILVARSEVEAELLRLMIGNPKPPQLTIVREHGKKEVLRKCSTIWHGLYRKEREAYNEGKMTDEEKDALLEARAKKSVQGAVAGDSHNITVAAIEKATKAKKPIRSKFDIELVDARNKTAVERFLALEVADDAEERLTKLRTEADNSRRNSKKMWLVHRANESGDGPDGEGAIMWYKDTRQPELRAPVSKNGVGGSWKGVTMDSAEASNAAGAEDGFLWKDVLWVVECKTDAEKAAAIEAGAGTVKKPSARFIELRVSGLLS